jgi:ankyrin repeat protein
MCGFTDIVKELLDAGANPNLQKRNGWTALMFATLYGYTDIVSLLLKKGANPFIRDIWHDTALDTAKTYEEVNIQKILERYMTLWPLITTKQLNKQKDFIPMEIIREVSTLLFGSKKSKKKQKKQKK